MLRIGAVAELLGVHPRTLRLYEERGLIEPHRRSGQRLFSQNDVIWFRCLRRLIHEDGYTLDAIVKLLDFLPCWELRNCTSTTCQGADCPAAKDRRLSCAEIMAIVCREGKNCQTCSACDVEQVEVQVATL